MTSDSISRPGARRPALLTALLRAVVPGLLLFVAPAVHAAHSAAREWNEQLMAAIRINVPNPPAHARNLHHTAVAMYSAWAAYHPTAVGYIYNEKISPLPPDHAATEAARHEAISYAAYRVLSARFATGQGSAVTLGRLDAKLAELGYSRTIAQAALTNDPTPAELGKRVGQAILTWGTGDGFSNTAFPQAYTAAINPNMDLPLNVTGTNGAGVLNAPLGYGIPAATNPNFWQPLSLSVVVDQNGIPQPGGTQSFVGVQGLATTPFAQTRTDPVRPWLDPFGGPSRLSVPGQPSTSDAEYKAQALDNLIDSSELNDPALVDISPGKYGNNDLGFDNNRGYSVNPMTGKPYAANLVKRGDFTRVLAEFWADGPNSETPPGHWHVLANQIADDPLLEKRIRGTGPVLNDLEWDVKVYFALSAATHDAACVAWCLKRFYSGPRPITMIRYMGTKGQSSDPKGPSYHTQGLLLKPDVCEVITAATAAPGGKHEQIWDVKFGAAFPGTGYIGQIAVFSWPGEHPGNLPAPSIATNQSMVRWMLAKDWLPFQRKTFNTPAFPGYTSGHSTFSRAAAEALTLLTGSAIFPGGFHHHTVAANSMQIDLGPSEPVDLQWCTYYDAADQAGQSRRWGGIHPYEDDYHGRRTGAIAGKAAYKLAEKYWTGAILSDAIIPVLTVMPGGNVRLTWNATRGMNHKVQSSPNLTTWSDESTFTMAYDTNGTWTSAAPPVGPRLFYRIVRSTSP